MLFPENVRVLGNLLDCAPQPKELTENATLQAIAEGAPWLCALITFDRVA